MLKKKRRPAGPPKTNKTWTPADTELLQQHWAGPLQTKRLTNLLGCNKMTLYAHAKRLGLGPRPAKPKNIQALSIKGSKELQDKIRAIAWEEKLTVSAWVRMVLAVEIDRRDGGATAGKASGDRIVPPARPGRPTP